MPHIIIEHSANIKDKVNYQKLFQALIRQMKILEIVKDDKQVKCRVYKNEDFYVAENNYFIHTEIALLSGRKKENLYKMAAILKKIIQNYFPNSAISVPDNISLEVREIDKNLYQK